MLDIYAHINFRLVKSCKWKYYKFTGQALRWFKSFGFFVTKILAQQVQGALKMNTKKANGSKSPTCLPTGSSVPGFVIPSNA
jgi:hypothetical protein